MLINILCSKAACKHLVMPRLYACEERHNSSQVDVKLALFSMELQHKKTDPKVRFSSVSLTYDTA